MQSPFGPPDKLKSGQTSSHVNDLPGLNSKVNSQFQRMAVTSPYRPPSNSNSSPGFSSPARPIRTTLAPTSSASPILSSRSSRSSRVNQLGTAPRTPRSPLAPTSSATPHKLTSLSAAKSAPSSSAARASQNAAVSSLTHPCQQCHLPQSKFYCDSCLLSRILAHHKEINRLSMASDKVKTAISHILGIGLPSSIIPPSVPQISTVIDDQSLPDPFIQTKDHPTSLSHSISASISNKTSLQLQNLIRLRARKAQMAAKIQELLTCVAESRNESKKRQETMAEVNHSILRRKQNLAKAWSNLEGASSSSHLHSTNALKPKPCSIQSRWSPQTNPGGWPGQDMHGNADTYNNAHIYTTDVYQQGEQQEPLITQQQANPSPVHGLQLGELVSTIRTDVQRLGKECKQVADELRKTRAILAREAFSIFAVSDPDSVGPQLGSSSGSKPEATPKRYAGLSERYMPGAFAFGRDTDRSPMGGFGILKTSRLSGEAAPASSGSVTESHSSHPNDWTIAGLVLPLPSDIRRFPRDTINGAITHTVHLLQLLANYLGVALPFTILHQAGKFSIRPDPLWDGGGGSSTKSLHLSSAAFSVLSAPPTSSGSTTSRFTLGESMLGAASTLSTLESFIQLPSGSQLAWGFTSAFTEVNKPADPQQADDQTASGAGRQSMQDDTATKSPRIKPDQAAKSFVSALVMLYYDVAYLASTQGVKVDLVSAAASSLRLLHQTVHHPNLGKKAHNNRVGSSGIKDLSFHQLDFDQLVQILEPMKAGFPSAKGTAWRKSRTLKGRDETKPIMEQSYVDAREAAASVLDIKDPSQLARPKAKASDTSHGSSSVKEQQQQQQARNKSSTSSKDASRNSAVKLAHDSSRQGSHTPSSCEPSRLGEAPNAQRVVPCRQTPVHPATVTNNGLPHPTSLDFLRRRGRDIVVQQSKSDKPIDQEVVGVGVGKTDAKNGNADHGQSCSLSNKSREQTGSDTTGNNNKNLRRTAAGAVIFNGVEIGVDDLQVEETRKVAGKVSAFGKDQKNQEIRLSYDRAGEEDWDLV